MKVLLLGSTGFVGSHFLRALRATSGVFVLAPNRKSLDLMDELKVCEIINDFAPDLVVNCAVKVHDLDQSIKSNLNIIRALSASCVYFQVGSGAEYGRFCCPPNVRESFFGKIIPNDTYGIFKFMIAQTLSMSLAGRFLNLRTFGVFGDGEEKRRLIPSLVHSALDSGSAVILKDGVFSYVSVNDLVDFLMGWISRGCDLRGHYNFSGESPIFLSDVLRSIEKVLPTTLCSVSDCDDLAPPYWGDSSELLERSTWFKFRSLHDEMKSYISHLVSLSH
jgi:nucleoside-diphosphate-sugar epimerase